MNKKKQSLLIKMTKIRKTTIYSVKISKKPQNIVSISIDKPFEIWYTVNAVSPFG